MIALACDGVHADICPKVVCPYVGVGVINAQQAGGETDGEVCLPMLGLFLPLNQAKWSLSLANLSAHSRVPFNYTIL